MYQRIEIAKYETLDAENDIYSFFFNKNACFIRIPYIYQLDEK